MDGTLLSPRSFREMTTPVRLKDGATQNYGLGIGVGNSNGHLRLSHGGAVSGFTSQNTIWPDQKTAVVVLSNKDGSSAPGRITRELETLLLTPAEDPDEARLLDQAKTIFNGLVEGHLDRSLFTSNCNAYFSSEVIREYSSSLKTLGKPKSFEQSSFGLRGGFSERTYRIEFEGKTLRLVTRADNAGRLEQFQVSE
jgi:hypothetical protein